MRTGLLISIVLLGTSCILRGSPEEPDPVADCSIVADAVDVRIDRAPMPLESVRIDYILLITDEEGTPRAVPTEISLDPEPISWNPDNPFDSVIVNGQTASFVAPMVHQDYVLRITREGCPDQWYERDIWTTAPEHEGSVDLTEVPAGSAADDVAWSPDGTRFVVAGEAPFAILFDGDGNRLDSKRFPGEYNGWDNQVTWSPDGRWVAFGGLVLTVEDDELVPFTWLGEWLGVLFAPDGRSLFLTDGFALYRWDLEALEFEVVTELPNLIQLGQPIEPVDMSISPSGFVTVDRFVINPNTGLIVRTLACAQDPAGQEHVRVRVAEDGTYAWVQGEDHLCRIELATGDEIGSSTHLVSNTTSLAIHGDRALVTGWESAGALNPRTVALFTLTDAGPLSETTFGTDATQANPGGTDLGWVGGAAWSPSGEEAVLVGNLEGNLAEGLGAGLFTTEALLAIENGGTL